MIKKLTRSMVAIMTTTICVSAHAVDNYNSCTVQVAVSNPPVLPDENVAFNVTGENGIISVVFPNVFFVLNKNAVRIRRSACPNGTKK